MKFILAGAAAIGATLFASPAFAASAAVTADMCSQLTDQNLEQCCSADNWKDVVRSEDVEFCPPLKDDTSGNSGRKGSKLSDRKDGNNNNDATGSTGNNNNNNTNDGGTGTGGNNNGGTGDNSAN
jgi:hypothetical protein